MPNQYKIMTIEPTWESHPEAMGDKEKFWYRQPDKQNYWLFKSPRPSTGQHWAEKIVAEVAQLVDINHATVELAVHDNLNGSTTESFVPANHGLWHGNQILKDSVKGYNPDKKFQHSAHTLHNILQAIEWTTQDSDVTKQVQTTFIEYIVLDALVGNTDRHHENWGIIMKRADGQWIGRLAPSYDHASSLGRELLDERRARYLDEQRVGLYAEKGRGAIYWSETDKRAPSPLELVRRVARENPSMVRQAIDKLQTLDSSSIHSIINRVRPIG